MPKTNSESDFGGSITSDEEDVDAGPSSPVTAPAPAGQAFELPAPITAKRNLRVQTDVQPSSLKPVTPARPNPTRSARLSSADVNGNGVLDGSTLGGAARFRATARKVMQMHHSSSGFTAFRGAGAEPGVDPRRASAMMAYGHMKEKCAIQVIDYSSVRSKFHEFDNKQFVDFLETHGTKRESWAKVRWISIGGLSWDVLGTLALTYKLHPLSLEDVLLQRGHIRSKADYFINHLFLRVLCHSLGDPDTANDRSALSIANSVGASPITTLPRTSSPTRMDSYSEKDQGAGGDMESSVRSASGLFRRKNTDTMSRTSTTRDLEAGSAQSSTLVSQSNTEVMATLDRLKAGERVNVLLKNLFIFLLRDGTLITIHQTPTSTFPEPILKRLRTRDTLLRSTADASLLLQSILDLVVDQAVDVVEEYQKKILKLERDILVKPKMRSVRYLHILSGDLTFYRRTLQPLKSLVYGLRRYDLDRCEAVAASFAEDSAEADAAARKITGYMTHKSKVYLADVHDHVEYILSSMDMFASVAENLINYTFNMASYEMNEVMRRLTLATIIFLPLTLLTGYFGMNFDPMWSVHNNSDALFWKIAAPVMAVVIPLFMSRDFIRLKHYLEKKIYIKRTINMA